MKILHLIHSLKGGGAEQQLCYLAQALNRLGHEVHIAYHQIQGLQPNIEGVTLHKIDISSNYDPGIFFKFFKLTKKLKPDLINTWIMQMDIVGGIIAKCLKIPWVLREPSSKQAYPDSIKFFLRKKMARYAAAIVSNSSSGDSYWSDFVPKAKRHIIQNGIPIKKIENTKTSEFSFMDLKNKQPFIMTASRISADKTGNKNLLKVLEALKLINQQKTLYGLICGQGPQLEQLKGFTEKHELSEKVFFPGNLSVELVWALMKEAKAFITMSEFEGCPNTVLEAMANKCPLIVSDIPAHREILDDSSALFVNLQNHLELPNAILKLQHNASEANERAGMAYKKVQGWTIETMAKSYEKVYYSII